MNNYIRKFRWTLEGEHLQPYFMKDVKFDYINKLITFNYYNVINSDCVKTFINNLSSETLKFTALNEFGSPLYKTEFKGLEPSKWEEDFDYNNSDISYQTVVVKYEDDYTEYYSP